MSKSKTIIITTLALTVICIVATAALALTNELTADKIATIEKKTEEQAMTRVIPASEYTEGTKKIEGVVYYEALDANGEVIGHIFSTSANGYGGPVKVMTGVAPDGTIIAMEVLSAADETPGLGQKATSKSFWEQFVGKSEYITVVKSNPSDTEIQAITGATITSNAVKDAVNQALSAHSELVGGGK